METKNSENILSFLEGKNVLIFDTETTGLPERVPGVRWGSANEYWSYKMNEKYENARIVSIAWAFVRSYCLDTLTSEKIKEYIRYPEGFCEIPTTAIHGISYDDALVKGIPMADIIENCGLADAILECDYIIAHNIMFDIHILQNELHRLSIHTPLHPIVGERIGSMNTSSNIAMQFIEKIETMKELGDLICTGEIGKNVCKIELKSRGGRDTNRINKFKMPKLKELHNFLYGTEHEDQHSASGDVLAIMNCLKKI